MKALIFLILIWSSAAIACTAFSFIKNNSPIVGKSYDWYVFHGSATAFVNPRNVSRQGVSVASVINPATWRSLYASLTFSQFGSGLPIGGMNERGLVVEMLQFDDTVYPSALSKPFVNESQWTQYQLDNFGSTDEVVEHVTDLRIEKAFIGIHYFVSDAFGRTAVIDFIDGVPQVHYRSSLAISALTNDSYEDLCSDFSQKGFTGLPRADFFTRSSKVRFRTAAKYLLSSDDSPESGPRYGARILSNVSLNGLAYDALLEVSQWRIIYQPALRLVHFKSRKNDGWTELDLNASLIASQTPLFADLDRGSLFPKFHFLSRKKNDEIIDRNGWLLSTDAKNLARSVYTEE